MKLKITNQYNAEVLELDGTPDELTKFVTEYKKNFQNPLLGNVRFNSCSHDYDTSSTNPVCKKCGVAMFYQYTLSPQVSPFPQPWTSGFITTTHVAANN